LVSRRTAALQTRAVVGWRLRQSLLQRWLGLASLTATTAAGNGQCQALDLPAADAVALADRAVPGRLAPFVIDQPAPRSGGDAR
ncbi:MAG: PH domain-containing protein, partial [Natronosporangium sp.]